MVSAFLFNVHYKLGSFGRISVSYLPTIKARDMNEH